VDIKERFVAGGGDVGIEGYDDGGVCGDDIDAGDGSADSGLMIMVFVLVMMVVPSVRMKMLALVTVRWL